METTKQKAERLVKKLNDKVSSEGIDELEAVIIAKDFAENNPDKHTSRMFTKCITSEEEGWQVQTGIYANLCIADKMGWNLNEL